MEFRCGQYMSWEGADDPEAPGPTDLRPMHYVVMNAPAGEIGPEPEKSFTVDNGRLARRDGDAVARYTKHDFVLLSIEPLKLRHDYRQLEFYKLWLQFQEELTHGELTAAERAWRRAQGAIYSSELTQTQQTLLTAEYTKRHDERIAQFATQDDHAFRGKKFEALGLVIDEQDPAEILAAQM
jgi:hypothetical protein